MQLEYRQQYLQVRAEALIQIYRTRNQAQSRRRNNILIDTRKFPTGHANVPKSILQFDCLQQRHILDLKLVFIWNIIHIKNSGSFERVLVESFANKRQPLDTRQVTGWSPTEGNRCPSYSTPLLPNVSTALECINRTPIYQLERTVSRRLRRQECRKKNQSTERRAKVTKGKEALTAASYSADTCCHFPKTVSFDLVSCLTTNQIIHSLIVSNHSFIVSSLD